MDIQLDLFLDYANNVKLYPAFQEYFRKSKPPLLAIWGRFDTYFIPPGAEAFQRDIPNATVQFLDTGHFATETHVVEIAAAMRQIPAEAITQRSSSHQFLSCHTRRETASPSVGATGRALTQSSQRESQSFAAAPLAKLCSFLRGLCAGAPLASCPSDARAFT